MLKYITQKSHSSTSSSPSSLTLCSSDASPRLPPYASSHRREPLLQRPPRAFSFDYGKYLPSTNASPPFPTPDTHTMILLWHCEATA